MASVRKTINLSLALFVCACLCSGAFAADAAAPAKVVVTGVVFVDTNANGKQDPGERGLGEVRVSDSVHIVLTDRAGNYTLDDIGGDSRFVFVVTPCGYKHDSSFYKRINKDAATFRADFALTPSPESNHRSFGFAQITDIHVQSEYDSLLEDLKEIAGLKPDFIITTGDQVNDGRKREQIETWKAGIDRSPLPVFCCPGNHDVGGGSANYEDILGPTYYSFDYGGCHFVVINSVVGDDGPQYSWLKRDLAAAKGMPVLAFQHYQPQKPLMNILSEYKTLAIFSGHWHSTKVFPYRDSREIMYVNMPSLRFGGIDSSARGFLLARVNNGKLTFQRRLSGIKQHLAVSVPADGAKVASGRISILASGYDSACLNPALSYSVDGGAFKQMKPCSDMSWTAPAKLGVGKHTVTVKAEFAPSQIEQKQVSFEVAGGTASQPTPGTDWPMFHQNASRTGVTADAVAPPLHLAWAVPLGGTAHITSPVVAGDSVYIGISDEDNSGHAGVYALDAATGRIKWHRPTTSSIKHTVSVQDGRVYTATVEGLVLALDATSGEQLWSYNLGGGISRWMYGGPVVDNGVVYAGSGPKFVALDAKTGNLVWNGEEIGGDWISCPILPCVSPGSVFTGVNWGKGVYAVNRRTGKIRWNHASGFGGMYASPAYSDGKYINGGGEGIIALDAATGKEVWEMSFNRGGTMSSPAVTGDRVVAGGTDGAIYCGDITTGKTVWNTPAGKSIMFFQPYSRDAYPIISSPAIAGGVVYCGSGDGKLYALSLADGKVLWSYDCGLPITSSPAVSGNAVYISSYDGTVYAFCGG